MEKEILNYIKEWESKCYTEGIPDTAPLEIFDKVPSYHKIAVCILKNDLRPLGIEPKKSKYYSILKRIEIDAREYNGKQIKIKL